MGNYENEFQFQFQLGLYRRQQVIFNENDLLRGSIQQSALSPQAPSSPIAASARGSSPWADC
jgi:hypothetical protein